MRSTFASVGRSVSVRRPNLRVGQLLEWVRGEVLQAAVAVGRVAKEADQVEGFVKAVHAEGVEAGGIYNKGVPDWHMYPHWKMLMEKMMPTERGCPFNCSLSGPVPDYKPDACPQTMEILGRSVHLDIPPQLTPKDCEQVAEAIRKVSAVLVS